jgi:hypothetical protein
VLLPVLESLVAFEVHAQHYGKGSAGPQGARSVLQRLLDVHPPKTLGFFNFFASKKSKMQSNRESRAKHRAAVRTIDPTVQFMPGSRGRVGAGKGQCLCIGSTHQKGYRDVLRSLAKLPHIERIIECYFE